MKAVALPDKVEPEKKPPSQLVDMETARRMVDEALEKQTSKFEKFQQFQYQQNQAKVPEQTNETDDNKEGMLFEEDSADMVNFDRKAFRSVSNTLKTIQQMKNAFESPPSPIEAAVSEVVQKVSIDVASKMLGGVGGGGTGIPVGRSSFIIDLLNTAAAHGFGESLGGNIQGAIQALGNVLGPQKSQELADNINRKIGGQPAELTEGDQAEKSKDMVLQLDPNNPEHIKQYASVMGLSLNAAKGMLENHQNDIRNARNINTPNPSTANTDQLTNAVSLLLQEVTNMKGIIVDLQNKVDNKKKPKEIEPEYPEVNEDRKWDDENEIPRQNRVNIERREVNLFASPIKVNVDDIGGANIKNSFFEDPKPQSQPQQSQPKPEKVKEEPKESVLEEVKDKDGNSTFKMSGETEEILEEELEEELDEPEEKEELEKTSDESVESKVEEKVEEPSKEADIKKENEKVDTDTPTQGTLDKQDTPKRKFKRIVKHQQEIYNIDNELVN
jgi:hypothetical protein